MVHNDPTAKVSEIPGRPPHEAELNSDITKRGLPGDVFDWTISMPGFCHAAKVTAAESC